MYAHLLTAAGLTAAVGLPVQAAVADSSEPDTEYCIAYAITREEAAAGEVSEIVCSDAPALLQRAPAALITLALHYDGLNGQGPVMAAQGSSCSDVTVFGSGSSWNNRIESSLPMACSKMKHYDTATFSGDAEYLSSGGLQNLTTLRNRTSSIGYVA